MKERKRVSERARKKGQEKIKRAKWIEKSETKKKASKQARQTDQKKRGDNARK